MPVITPCYSALTQKAASINIPNKHAIILWLFAKEQLHTAARCLRTENLQLQSMSLNDNIKIIDFHFGKTCISILTSSDVFRLLPCDLGTTLLSGSRLISKNWKSSPFGNGT